MIACSRGNFGSGLILTPMGASCLGPLVSGLALQMTGSYRLAALSLAIFFVIGFALLSRVNVEAAAAEAHSASQ